MINRIVWRRPVSSDRERTQRSEYGRVSMPTRRVRLRGGFRLLLLILTFRAKPDLPTGDAAERARTVLGRDPQRITVASQRTADLGA